MGETTLQPTLAVSPVLGLGGGLSVSFLGLLTTQASSRVLHLLFSDGVGFREGFA